MLNITRVLTGIRRFILKIVEVDVKERERGERVEIVRLKIFLILDRGCLIDDD